MALDLAQTAEIAVAILVSIGLHEFAHAKVADMCGDDTPRLQGRVTLNLLKHLDPMGTMMILMSLLSGGFGIGWGKPVQVNPSRMRNPRWDHFWSVAAGPLSNLLQASVAAIIVRIMVLTHATALVGLAEFLVLYTYINIGLMLFNLVPMGPLDGHWLVGAFMPLENRLRWYRFNAQYGWMLLLGWVFIGYQNPDISIGHFFSPVRETLLHFLLPGQNK